MDRFQDGNARRTVVACSGSARIGMRDSPSMGIVSSGSGSPITSLTVLYMSTSSTNALLLLPTDCGIHGTCPGVSIIYFCHFIDKNRRDISKSQPKWTASKMESHPYDQRDPHPELPCVHRGSELCKRSPNVRVLQKCVAVRTVCSFFPHGVLAQMPACGTVAT
eukprot:SAG25_NODE_840_length_5120_cov_3.796455_3_plen_164_part_00